MIGQIVKRFGLLAGLVMFSAMSATAQPPERSLIADALPWGLSWQDVDTVITQKVIAADSALAIAINRPEPGVIEIEGTPFSKFTARAMRLHYHDDAGIVASEWRFTGTRILSAIGVYDYLRPALVIELGKPNAMNDTMIADAQDLRNSTRSDRALFQKLKKEDVPLSSSWRITSKGKKFLVDLRVDNESGETVLSIVDSKMAEKIIADAVEKNVKEEGENVESVDIADSTSDVEGIVPDSAEETTSQSGDSAVEGAPESETEEREEGSNHGKPS